MRGDERNRGGCEPWNPQRLPDGLGRTDVSRSTASRDRPGIPSNWKSVGIVPRFLALRARDRLLLALQIPFEPVLPSRAGVVDERLAISSGSCPSLTSARTSTSGLLERPCSRHPFPDTTTLALRTTAGFARGGCGAPRTATTLVVDTAHATAARRQPQIGVVDAQQQPVLRA
jgi:hypothetical protein